MYCSYVVVLLFFFFFQAEDGIRDADVTGVQTCALPILNKHPSYLICFPSTRSEIVIPIKGAGRVLGEIDIDSNRLSAFTLRDKEILEETASMLATYLQSQRSSPQSQESVNLV